MIRFQSLTRNIEIGANCYLLSLGDKRILIDSGMHPKAESSDAIPQFDKILNEPLDAAILSHAHLDHSGSLPVIQRHYPEMPVFMSEATDALAQALLHNSVNVMTSKREELGINEYPLFTHREIHKANRQWHSRRNGKKFELYETGGASCTFYDAGHVMGAVGSLFEFSGKKICVQCHAPLNGRKKFTGILTDFKNQSIHLEVDGQLQTIPINRVAKANLVIEI